MSEAVHGLAEQEVLHEAVTVRPDHKEVDRPAREPPHELSRAIRSVQEDRLGLEPPSAEYACNFF